MKRSILVGLCGWIGTGMMMAAVPAPEELLPAEAWVVVSIPDVSQARVRTEDWSYSKLFQDPSMKPFKDRFMTKWTAEVVEPLERELGVSCKQLGDLAQGQLTLALTSTGLDQENPDPGLLVLIDSRDRRDALTSLLAELKRKWTDSGKKVKTVSLRGVEFTGLTFDPKELGRTLEKALPGLASDENAPESEPGERESKEVEWFFGQADSLLLIGDHVADLEKVLSRMQGGSAPALAGREVFAANYPIVLRGALAYVWVDMGTILQRLLKPKKDQVENDNAAPFGLNPDKLMEPLGVLGLQTVSAALRYEDNGGLMDVLINVPAQKRKGLFDLLRFEPLDADPPPFVPAEVISFSRLRLNLRDTWNRAEKMLGEFNPGLAEMVKLIVDAAGKDKDPSFDLRQNLIANLGNDIISYEKAPRDASLEALADLPSIYLVGSPRPEQLASALKALSSLMPIPGGLKEREFLGRTVYTFDVPQDEGEARRLHFSPSGGYVAISLDEATLEEFLRTSGNPGSSLRENRDLMRAAQNVGGMSTGFFGYENQRRAMRSVVEALRKGSGSTGNVLSNSALQSVDTDNLKEWVDFTLLPPFDQIEKYFHIRVQSGQVIPEGFRFKVFTPNPPAP